MSHSQYNGTAEMNKMNEKLGKKRVRGQGRVTKELKRFRGTAEMHTNSSQKPYAELGILSTRFLDVMKNLAGW